MWTGNDMRYIILYDDVELLTIEKLIGSFKQEKQAARHIGKFNAYIYIRVHLSSKIIDKHITSINTQQYVFIEVFVCRSNIRR